MHRWSQAVWPSGLAAAGPAVALTAAILPPLRPWAAMALAAGWLALWAGGRRQAVTWAAVLPIGVAFSWPWVLGSDVPLGPTGCVDPISSIVVRRLLQAAAVLAVIAVLAGAHRSDRLELGLRRPSMGEGAVAAVGLAVLAIGGLVIGPAVARPFFGQLDFPIPPGVVWPAILFGLANGTLEEVAYRGSMQSWLARRWPTSVAIGYQGLLFGVIHAGQDVVGLQLLFVVLLSLVGVAAGILRLRTRSIAMPLGIHIGADIALYVGLACRAAV